MEPALTKPQVSPWATHSPWVNHQDIFTHGSVPRTLTQPWATHTYSHPRNRPPQKCPGLYAPSSLLIHCGTRGWRALGWWWWWCVQGGSPQLRLRAPLLSEDNLTRFGQALRDSMPCPVRPGQDWPACHHLAKALRTQAPTACQEPQGKENT